MTNSMATLAMTGWMAALVMTACLAALVLTLLMADQTLIRAMQKLKPTVRLEEQEDSLHR
jgi:hypothetical protein